MSILPNEHCPTADELLAFERGSGDFKRRSLVEAHVSTCADCARARESLRAAGELDQLVGDLTSEGFFSYLHRERPDHFELAQKHLAEQQGRMKQMLDSPRPNPATGQFWIVRAPDARASLVLILDYHPAEAGEEGFVNLAPVTEEDWLAAEWSLSFSAVHSGLGVLAVIHVDFDQSVGERFLDRCIGQLPVQSGAEFVRVVRAWSNSEAPPRDLLLGRLGQVDIRTRIEWQALDKLLSTSLRSIAAMSDQVSLETGMDLSVDGATTPTGGASASPVPRPANPLRVSRSTTGADPSVVRPAAFDRRQPEPMLRVAESAPPPYGSTAEAAGSEADEASVRSQPGSFLSELKEFLHAEHKGDLQAWATKHGMTLTWEQLEPFSTVLLADLFKDHSWQQRLMKVRGDIPQSSRRPILKIATELFYFYSQKSGLVAGKQLEMRAARTQRPSDSRPKKNDE